ncbi:hypothetical protein D4A92_23615 (plasmid) [Rhizobium rosettiformans]|uniref:Uncharacterized protein n=1 Tax=Rhizobium rosettiformans TaxID=1368430 RepID=A0ABX7F1T0_9HYPH|nr:hypothetical protein [Rhizobium rosettiformans]QRF54494.1 hypothetical protein D4A92_23615 [Rhizobium rosettiformans]
MADDSTITLKAVFDTRERADIAVEHLVQQHGVERPDIFIQAASAKNTAGTSPSGGDTARSEGSRHDAPLKGEIEVSADIASHLTSVVRQSLNEAGAISVTEG